MPALDLRLAPTVAAQHGLVTRRQVFAAGGSQAAIDRRLRSGGWSVAERGVYAVAGHPWTWRRHLAAVVLSLPSAFASHRAGAKLLGVGAFDNPPIECSVPDGRLSRRSFEERERASGCAVVVHQAEDFLLEAPWTIDGIPTSSPLRLAVDVGRVIPFERYRKLVGDIRREHGVTWVDLDRLWRLHSRRGRDGCGPLHELLDRHFGAAGAPSEVVEARCSALLTSAGLPEPEHQFRVERPDGRTAILDLAYPVERVGIETEGAIHEWDEVRRLDHRRRNELQLAGWDMYHFTWEDVTYDGNQVVHTVRAALATARRNSGWA